MIDGPTATLGHEPADRVFDHFALRRRMGAAKSALEALSGTGDIAPADAGRARRALEQLAEELRLHFHYEEAEAGFFDEVLEQAPHLAERLAALRQDHPPLHRRALRLATDARGAGGDPDAWRRLGAAFQGFAAALRRHESAEDALVADGLMQDEPG